MQMEFLRSLRQSYHHIPGSKLCPEKGLDVNFWFLSVQMEIKGHSGSCWLLASSSALLSVCLQNQTVINRAAMHLQSDQTLYTKLANIAGQNDFDVPPFRYVSMFSAERPQDAGLDRLRCMRLSATQQKIARF